MKKPNILFAALLCSAIFASSMSAYYRHGYYDDRGGSVGRGALFGGLTGATIGGIAGGGKGAGIGLGVGALTGIVAGAAADDHNKRSKYYYDYENNPDYIEDENEALHEENRILREQIKEQSTEYDE